MNGLVKGDNASNREGDQVRNISFRIHGTALKASAATTTILRVLLIIDKQSNNGTPAVADILETAGSGAYIALPNINGRRRFVILRDVSFSLDTGSMAIRPIDIYLKLNMKTLYQSSANAGTAADIESNTLWLLHTTNEAVNVPTFTYMTRLRFVDN